MISYFWVKISIVKLQKLFSNTCNEPRSGGSKFFHRNAP